jgi:hypothetical protein
MSSRYPDEGADLFGRLGEHDGIRKMREVIGLAVTVQLEDRCRRGHSRAQKPPKFLDHVRCHPRNRSTLQP